MAQYIIYRLSQYILQLPSHMAKHSINHRDIVDYSSTNGELIYKRVPKFSQGRDIENVEANTVLKWHIHVISQTL